MRKSYLIAGFVLLWMLGIGAAALLSQGGSKPNAAASAPTGTDFSANPTGPTRTITLPSGGTVKVAPLGPNDSHGRTSANPTPNELLGDQQAAALNGLPALKAIPYSDSQISVSFAALEGKRAIVNVRYGSNLKGAQAAFASFLARQHDALSHYRPRYISKTALLKQVDESQRVMLAMRGFTLLTFLPVHNEPFAVTLLGERGSKVALAVSYHGSLAAAKSAFAAYLLSHHDRLGHYLVSYRAVR